MSLLTNQIDELRAYAKDRKGELAKLIADAADTIEVLSAKTIEPERKKGKWIPMTVSSGRDSWRCSVCGRRARGKKENLPYCHCGAKMEEGE